MVKHIPCKCNFDGKNVIQTTNGIVITVEASTKTMEYYVCKDDYDWNPSTCTCEFNKEGKFDENLENLTWMKNAFDKLVITCDGTMNITKTSSKHSIDKTDYCFIVILILRQSYVYYANNHCH